MNNFLTSGMQKYQRSLQPLLVCIHSLLYYHYYLINNKVTAAVLFPIQLHPKLILPPLSMNANRLVVLLDTGNISSLTFIHIVSPFFLDSVLWKMKAQNVCMYRSWEDFLFFFLSFLLSNTYFMRTNMFYSAA